MCSQIWQLLPLRQQDSYLHIHVFEANTHIYTYTHKLACSQVPWIRRLYDSGGRTSQDELGYAAVTKNPYISGLITTVVTLWSQQDEPATLLFWFWPNTEAHAF